LAVPLGLNRPPGVASSLLLLGQALREFVRPLTGLRRETRKWAFGVVGIIFGYFS